MPGLNSMQEYVERQAKRIAELEARVAELERQLELATAVCRDLDAWRQTMAGSAQIRAWFSARYALFSSFSRWHRAASSPAASGATGDDGEGDGD